MIVVEAAGALTTVQDLGRPGFAHLGVGRSGAVDRPSLRLANRLVGNAETAAGLECTFGGLVVRFERAAWVAVTGAPGPVRVGGHGESPCTPIAVGAGQQLELGMPDRGVRSYLAVRGGVATEPVLGSRSTDVLAGLGPAPLAAGARLPVGEPMLGYPGVDIAPVAALPDVLRLRALAGPRDDWFTADAMTTLGSQPYEVTPASNRVGVRLSGPPLSRRITGELPSEGMVEGALQVSPDGQPVLFLADHPVTGGYPVIAVVEPEDVPIAAQARPGQTIHFTVSRVRTRS